MALVIVFMGPPGSGKSTQAALLSQKCGIPRLEMGEVLREMAAQNTALGRGIRGYVDRGLLVPEHIIKQVVLDHLRRPEFQRGFIIDGFPRNVQQARTFDKMLQDFHKEITSVVLFEVVERIAVERLSRRRTCTGCGFSHTVKLGLAADESECSRCGGKLLQRRDDRPDIIKARLRVFFRETAPLIAFYEERRLLARIDASRSVNQVFDELTRVVPCDSRN